jgi:hypothetical protein
VTPRLPLPSDASTPFGAPDASGLCPTLAPARANYYRQLVRLRGVDPVTTELVRIRNGRFQECHL